MLLKYAIINLNMKFDKKWHKKNYLMHSKFAQARANYSKNLSKEGKRELELFDTEK